MCRSIFAQLSFSLPFVLMLLLLLVIELMPVPGHLSSCRPNFDYDYEQESEYGSNETCQSCRSAESFWFSNARVVEWQTRTFGGRMPKGLRVQVPPRARSPFHHEALILVRGRFSALLVGYRSEERRVGKEWRS